MHARALRDQNPLDDSLHNPLFGPFTFHSVSSFLAEDHVRSATLLIPIIAYIFTQRCWTLLRHAVPSRSSADIAQDDGGASTDQSASSSIIQRPRARTSVSDLFPVQLQPSSLLSASVAWFTCPHSAAEEDTDAKDLDNIDTSYSRTPKVLFLAHLLVKYLLRGILPQGTSHHPSHLALFHEGRVRNGWPR